MSCYQPRSQSSLAISDVASLVKLVGKIYRIVGTRLSFYFITEIELIFTKKVLHLGSFWKWELMEFLDTASPCISKLQSVKLASDVTTSDRWFTGNIGTRKPFPENV